MAAPEKASFTRSSVSAVVVNTSWMLVSTLFAAGTQWLIVSVVAHREGATGLGQISLAQAYVTGLSYVAWLALRNHYIVEEDRYPFNDYLFLRLIFPALVFLMLVLAAGAGGISVWTTIFAFSCLKFAEGLSDLNSGVFQRFHKSHSISISAVLRFVATCSVFPGIYYITESADPSLFFLAFAWLAIYVLFDNRARRKLTISQDSLISTRAGVVKRRWELFAFSFPLGVSGAIMILNTYTPRFGIDHYFGRAALGHFTAVQYFMNFGGMLVAVVCQASLPLLTRQVADRSTRHFLLLTAGLIAFVLIGSLVALLLIQVTGRQLLIGIYGSGFGEVQPLFAEAMPCMLFVYVGSVMAAAATALRLYRTVLFAYIASACFAASLTWLLLPYFGLIGSFLALGIAGMVQAAVLIAGILVQWRLNLRSLRND